MTIQTYTEFLQSKTIIEKSQGLNIKTDSKVLFDWQEQIANWALSKGRACLFEDSYFSQAVKNLEKAASAEMEGTLFSEAK